MHLSKLPTIFIKDGVERLAYHTIEAKELISFGWSEKGKEKVKKAVQAKPEAAKQEEPKEVKAKTQRKSLFVKSKEVNTDE
tara:strand:- start:1022 stop:1264 length:243 start_codon:yes stop_codon:yes gene_type:complete